jgi:uncharacterized membrane protein
LSGHNNTRKARPEPFNDKDELHRGVNVPATFACLGSLIFWSLGPIFVKYLTGYLDSWTQNLLRYSVACLFWLPFLLFSVRTKRLDKRVWRRALVPAAANVLMQSLYAAAFYYIGPAFMVLQMKTNIIWIAAFSFIFFSDERALVASKQFWIGLILSIVGVVGVMYNKVDLAQGRIITGIIVTQAAAFMWGVYTISVKVAFKDIDSRSGFSVTSIYRSCRIRAFVRGCTKSGSNRRLAMGMCRSLRHNGNCICSYPVLRRNKTNRGHNSGFGHTGSAVYRSGDFTRHLQRVDEYFPVVFRSYSINRLGTGDMGAATSEI